MWRVALVAAVASQVSSRCTVTDGEAICEVDGPHEDDVAFLQRVRKAVRRRDKAAEPLVPDSLEGVATPKEDLAAATPTGLDQFIHCFGPACTTGDESEECQQAKAKCNCDVCMIAGLTEVTRSCAACSAGSRRVLGEAAHEGEGSGAPRHRTMDEELALCPKLVGDALGFAAREGIRLYQTTGVPTVLLTLLNEKAVGTPTLSSGSVDTFTVMYYFLTRLQISLNSAVHSDSVTVPQTYGPFDTVSIGHLTLPAVDWDSFNRTEYEARSAPPPHIMPEAGICILGPVSLDFPLNDWLGDDNNTWQEVLGVADQTKHDWIASLWDPYKKKDGSPQWPTQEIDMRRFRKADMWDDSLEKALVFNMLGTHRVRACQKYYGGETLPMVLQLNDYSALKMRQGFARYGADMYFTEDGMPALIVTPSGKEVARGDPDWQYWKFVFRSSLLSIVTLVDHLHLTHYRTGGILSASSRRALPPSHPARRFLTVFTFGTIDINYKSLFVLSAKRSSLNRAAAIDDFPAVNTLVPESLPDITSNVAAFADEAEFRRMPPALQNAPFYADGQLIYDALKDLVEGYFSLYRSQWCDQNDVFVDEPMLNFVADLNDASGRGDYAGVVSKTCTEAARQLLAGIYTATAFHRHVGQVGDVTDDPDLASFSWKEGEAFGRPMQMLISSTIAAITGVPKPKLTEDYSHVFKGMDKEDEAVAVWDKFRTRLMKIGEEVDARNSKREVPYYRAHPDIVECSVAV